MAILVCIDNALEVFEMSFFDDIGDAIGDVASVVGEGASALASEAYSTVLSPSESFVMKGLGSAGSAVTDLFGDLDITDIGDVVGDVGKIAAFPLAGMPMNIASEALGGLIKDSSLPEFFENNSIAELLNNNSIAEIIKENPLAGKSAGNVKDSIKKSNKGLFDVAAMLKR